MVGAAADMHDHALEEVEVLGVLPFLHIAWKLHVEGEGDPVHELAQPAPYRVSGIRGPEDSGAQYVSTGIERS